MSVDILRHATRAVTVPDWLGSSLNLSELWPALISGTARIVDSGATEAHHYIQFETTIGPAHRDACAKLTPHRIRLLERVLLGDPPKVIAIDLGCSTSSVAAAVNESLRAMGLGSSRIPALLVLLLHASRGNGHASIRLERTVDRDGGRQWVTCARPESYLEQTLSTGELDVVSLLIEGKRHQEIARHRRTSVRTVANQIANAYRKLGISGRMDLLCYLASGQEAGTNPLMA